MRLTVKQKENRKKPTQKPNIITKILSTTEPHNNMNSEQVKPLIIIPSSRQSNSRIHDQTIKLNYC